jgi:hypothetical protein
MAVEPFTHFPNIIGKLIADDLDAYLHQQPQHCRSAGMKLVFRKLLMASVFGFGAMAAPAALIIIEAANAPQPELRNPAYARALLSQGRLAWDDQQNTVGSSGETGYEKRRASLRRLTRKRLGMPTVLVSNADRLMRSAESSRFVRRIGLGFKILRPLAKLPSYVVSHRDAGKLSASVG